MKNKTRLTSLIIGYSFLYVPILLLVINSFNNSRLSNRWEGFTFKWYHVLFENEALLDAVMASLKIASISATVAVALGTLAAVIMVRFNKFPGRTLFSGLISAPLVMPDVITGLAVLMMFVTFDQLIGWPLGRGTMTITIAHITLSMAYVYMVVQARLKDFDSSLEEAAQDLGARPLGIFFSITLPLIAPALLASWLLAFALSLDDVVIASFLSGPGATTLPMLVFSSIRMGLNPEINALATIIIAFVAIGVTFTGIILSRKKPQY